MRELALALQTLQCSAAEGSPHHSVGRERPCRSCASNSPSNSDSADAVRSRSGSYRRNRHSALDPRRGAEEPAAECGLVRGGRSARAVRATVAHRVTDRLLRRRFAKSGPCRGRLAGAAEKHDPQSGKATRKSREPRRPRAGYLLTTMFTEPRPNRLDSGRRASPSTSSEPRAPAHSKTSVWVSGCSPNFHWRVLRDRRGLPECGHADRGGCRSSKGIASRHMQSGIPAGARTVARRRGIQANAGRARSDVDPMRGVTPCVVAAEAAARPLLEAS